MKLKFTDFGIACCYKDIIELNPILFKYPKLLEKVLNHELEHSKNTTLISGWITDLKLFLGATLEGFKFTLKHPKICFQSILPIWYHKGELCLNSFLIIAYSILLIPSLIFLFII